MDEIQHLRAELIPDIAGLWLHAMRGQRANASRELVDYFTEIFLRSPFSDPELPSLVYLSNARVVGFLGVLSRQMRFGDQPVRVAVGSQFVVERDGYRGPAAIQLMRRYFSGCQDLCFTDGAGEANAKLWQACGGDAARLYSFNWIRPLRPVATIRQNLLSRGGTALKLVDGLARIGEPLDWVLLRSVPSLAPRSPYCTRLVTGAEFFAVVAKHPPRAPLQPAYSVDSFCWLVEQAAAAKQLGQLRLVIAENTEGICGWFVYWAAAGAPAIVLDLGVRRRDQFDGVFRALVRDAAAQGSSCLKGQGTPERFVNLTENQCVFRQPNTSVLIHTRNPELRNAVLRGDAALSRLDGECWLRFSSEDWQRSSR